MATHVPERLSWLVDLLGVGPEDRLLGIGCGRGVAVDLVCARLGGGHVTGLDRSAKAIEAAEERNAHWVAAGRAAFRCGPATELGDVRAGSFDTVFAMNVNLFWVQADPGELALVRRVLAPGGTVHLAWEAPVRPRQPRSSRRSPGRWRATASAAPRSGRRRTRRCCA